MSPATNDGHPPGQTGEGGEWSSPVNFLLSRFSTISRVKVISGHFCCFPDGDDRFDANLFLERAKLANVPEPRIVLQQIQNRAFRRDPPARLRIETIQEADRQRDDLLLALPKRLEIEGVRGHAIAYVLAEDAEVPARRVDDANVHRSRPIPADPRGAFFFDDL